MQIIVALAAFVAVVTASVVPSPSCTTEKTTASVLVIQSCFLFLHRHASRVLHFSRPCRAVGLIILHGNQQDLRTCSRGTIVLLYGIQKDHRPSHCRTVNLVLMHKQQDFRPRPRHPLPHSILHQ
ncbi:hypothetical protein BC830DRAFT_224491 [Chytriomyces sp. MP71]|nr:hypothetical protein BC830DRAFT_224491 [Chytriomyces sp. MP71]